MKSISPVAENKEGEMWDWALEMLFGGIYEEKVDKICMLC